MLSTVQFHCPILCTYYRTVCAYVLVPRYEQKGLMIGSFVTLLENSFFSYQTSVPVIP